MADLLTSLKQARAGLQALSEMSRYQSDTVQSYVYQATIKLSAAIQQCEMERRNKKAEPLKEHSNA
jgi:hypothetical protein